MDGTRVSGLSEVLTNLNKSIVQIKGRTMRGLIRAQIAVRRSMDEASPKIPVDTNNLRASYYCITSKGEITEGQAPSFNGDKAAAMAAHHSAMLSQRQGAVAAISTNGREIVEMGFTANYALYVHENMEASFRRPGAGPKFLEDALRRNAREVLQIIAKDIKSSSVPETNVTYFPRDVTMA